MSKKPINMLGWKISEHGVPDSKLTIIGIGEKRSKSDFYWLCKCDCGNTISASRTQLLSGEIKSCGKYECKFSSIFKYNKYDLSGEYGIGYTTNTNKPFYFDLEDYDKIKNYCWVENKGLGYIKASARKGNANHILMHRLILDSINDSKMVVDHINHNPMDNRKENLRLVTRRQNRLNTPKINSFNKDTGYPGITIYNLKKGGIKYNVSICVNDKTTYLGRFNSLEEALKVREEAEIKYWGKDVEYKFQKTEIEDEE